MGKRFLEMIPNLHKGEYFFEAELTLDSWKGFLSRDALYNRNKNAPPATGRCKLNISFNLDTVVSIIPSEQINAYQYLMEEQEVIKKAILAALWEEYEGIQADYSDGIEPEEKEEFVPDVTNVEDFKKLIGLAFVHIHNVYKDDMAYVGYEFRCTWDEEHGMGVMTHKNRVVAIGGADVSILEWIAESDLNEAK